MLLYTGPKDTLYNMSDFVTLINILNNSIYTRTKDDIKELIDKFSTNNKTLHNVVLAAFKVKQKDTVIINALKWLYKLYVIEYPKISTRAVKLSHVRQVIKEHQSENAYIKSTHRVNFNITKKEKDKLEADYKKKIFNSNNKKTNFNLNDTMAKIRELAITGAKKNIYDLGILLLLVSGVRPVGLFKNVFNLIESKPAYIRLSNITKKRDKLETLDRPIILLSAKQFLTLLTRFKRHFTNKRTVTASGAFASDKQARLNERVILHFPQLKQEKNKSSMLRKLYISLAFHFYADSSKVNFNCYIKKILGHNSLNTTFSYSFINLIKPHQITKEPKPIDLKSTIDDDTADMTAGGFKKLSRTETKHKKIELLEKIYKQHGGKITNAKMRRVSGVGSRIINEFLKSKRSV